MQAPRLWCQAPEADGTKGATVPLDGTLVPCDRLNAKKTSVKGKEVDAW